MTKHGLLSTGVPGLNNFGEEIKSKLQVDYPKVGELVARGHYAVRISGCQGDCQIAFTGATDWQNCRRDGAYHWFDWNPTETGAHRISVRTRVENNWVKFDRNCRVK